MPSQEQGSLAQLAFKVSCTLVTAGNAWSGTVRYLSYDAIRVVAPGGHLGVGDSLTVEIDTPGGTSPFRAAGEVCRIVSEGREADYGIRLLALHHAQRLEIGRILDRIEIAAGLQRFEPVANRRVTFV